jgi:L-arabinonolactonase
MPELEARLLVDCQNLLGECVLWNPRDQRVYWTDVYAQRLYSCDAEGQQLQVRELPDRLGSFAFDPDGNLLAAFAKGLYRYHLGSGQREQLTSFEPHLPPTRLNDGRTDRAGRFVVGGCHQGFYNPVSSVVAYEGGSAARTLIEGVALTNGIAFSLDGTRMYFSDSETYQYHWYEYDPRSGELGPRHLLCELARGQGFADGSCVDADDRLWNARYHGGLVQQYHPDGTEALRVQVPTACPTCVCFGGPELDLLFVTTGRKDLSEEQRRSQPGAGGLFVVRPGVRGVPEARFGARLFAD